jgi:hypothetical protein
MMSGDNFIHVHVLVLSCPHSSLQILSLPRPLHVQAHFNIIKALRDVIIRVFPFVPQVGVDTQTAEITV